jgi:hypothetical protein
MDIDEEPEIRTLRSELLKALRRTAFETYVNLGGEGAQPSARRILAGHLFADGIIAAVTPEIFLDAEGRAFRASGGLHP